MNKKGLKRLKKSFSTSRNTQHTGLDHRLFNKSLNDVGTKDLFCRDKKCQDLPQSWAVSSVEY